MKLGDMLLAKILNAIQVTSIIKSEENAARYVFTLEQKALHTYYSLYLIFRMNSISWQHALFYHHARVELDDDIKSVLVTSLLHLW